MASAIVGAVAMRRWLTFSCRKPAVLAPSSRNRPTAMRSVSAPGKRGICIEPYFWPRRVRDLFTDRFVGRYEDVTDTAHGLQNLRPRGILFQNATQLQNLHVDRSLQLLIAAGAGHLQQAITRKRLHRIAGEGAQQGEVGLLQIDGRAVAAQGAGGGIEYE